MASRSPVANKSGPRRPHSIDRYAAADVPRAADAPVPPGASHRENRACEPNGDENAIIIQNEEPVAVAANFGIGPALDKRENQPRGAG